MEITRLYSNASDDLLRVDTITIDLTPPVYKDLRVGNDPGLQMRLGAQRVKTTNMASAASRVVATIEVNGEYDAWDSSTAILWVTKTLGNGQVVRFNMSNLPEVGDTV